MSRRLLPWQLEKQRTAKGLRELPKCEVPECKKRGMGFSRLGYWLCPRCAADERAMFAQRAQREKRP